TQIDWELGRAAGEPLPDYDYYYTVGLNVGTERSSLPTAGKVWRHLSDPVTVGLFPVRPAPADAPFTTVMSWQAHQTIEFAGRTYGQKDVEFDKLMDLPGRTKAPLELAVGGRGGENVPMERLREAGWRVRDALGVTLTFDAFRDYLAASRGEFGVC